MKKQNLEMLQLLESIEVMLQNGNSIHPDSVIRGAIRIAIGMDQYGMPEGLDTPEKHNQYLKDIGLIDIKKYRVWLEDAMEEELGFWWYCYLDNNKCLQDYNYPDDEPDTLQWFIDKGYKVEEVTND
jgi:hypothetical protein